MANPILEFDPAAEATGSPLTITTGNYALTSFSAPAPPAKFQWASSVDTEGSLLASSGHENRTVTIGQEVTGDAALSALQSKVSKLHREGGTLKYTTPAGDPVTFDVHASDGFEPQFDHLHYLGGVTAVQLSLPCKPYGRGAEQDLGDNVETTLPVLVFTETTIPGDMPALGRLVIDEDSATAQGLLLWAVQSRYVDVTTAGTLFYESEACQLADGTLAAGPAGASGAGSNTVLHNNLAAGPTSWSQLHRIGPSTSAHIGNFRVFARLRAPAANTGIVTVRLTWGSAMASASSNNTSIPLVNEIGAACEDTWMLVDLGQVILPKAITGSQVWSGVIEANSTVAGDDLYSDYVALFPIDEGSGEAVATTTMPGGATVAGSGSFQVRHDAAVFASGSSWRRAPRYEGDHLRVPASGAEARSARVIVKMALNDGLVVAGNEPSAGPIFADGAIGDLSARLFVTPRYLVLPE